MKHVYVFDMDNDRVKIGIAADVKKRISGVEHASGFGVRRHRETLAMPDDKARQLESTLHSFFNANRARGEYFKITFEEACAELGKRAPAEKVNLKKRVLTPQEKIASLVRLFAKTFCTTDKNERGVSGGGFLLTSFTAEFANWFNSRVKAFTCELRQPWAVDFYDRATGNEIPALPRISELLGIGAQKFRPDRSEYDKASIYPGIYWKQGTPQELALRQRVQRVRDAFTGLDQQAQDSIIGGFIASFIKPNLFKPEGLSFDSFADESLVRYLERRLSELCGEPFRVHIESERAPFYSFRENIPVYYVPTLLPYSSHRGIVAHPLAYELDDEATDVYYGSFTQILQRYCPLEIFFNKWGLRVRHQ